MDKLITDKFTSDESRRYPVCQDLYLGSAANLARSSVKRGTDDKSVKELPNVYLVSPDGASRETKPVGPNAAAKMSEQIVSPMPNSESVSSVKYKPWSLRRLHQEKTQEEKLADLADACRRLEEVSRNSVKYQYLQNFQNYPSPRGW
ncbi:MAG TPA: hypothetical protein V6C97_26035 [Oculatellaceae cyanobacterium]